VSDFSGEKSGHAMGFFARKIVPGGAVDKAV
jgi:hypothetical protein